MRFVANSWIVVWLILPGMHFGLAQSGPLSPPPNTLAYQLSIPVNEVSLLFRAEGPAGEPVTGLKLDDLTVLDNGRPPARISSFEAVQLLRPVQLKSVRMRIAGWAARSCTTLYTAPAATSSVERTP